MWPSATANTLDIENTSYFVGPKELFVEHCVEAEAAVRELVR